LATSAPTVRRQSTRIFCLQFGFGSFFCLSRRYGRLIVDKLKDMNHFDYLMSRMFVFGHNDFERWQSFLDDRGNEGWELVSVTQKTVPGPTPTETGDEYTLFFKRPKP
jgi:hypothetical protein